MIRILLLFLSIFIFSCKSESSKTTLFEKKIKKNLEDNAFIANDSFSIIELNVLSFESAPLDSINKEICYYKVSRLFKLSKENNVEDDLVFQSHQYKDIFLNVKLVLDTTIRGYKVTYFVKGVLITQNNVNSNILYDKVVAYFDNNDNLIYNELHFKNKRESEINIKEFKQADKNKISETPQVNLLSDQNNVTKYVFAKVKINIVQVLIGSRKPINPNDPTSPMGQDEKEENEYYIITNIKSINNYNSDKKYKFKDAVRKAAMGEKSGIGLLYSFDIKDIQIFEFNDYTNASENRERFENMKEITVYENF